MISLMTMRLYITIVELSGVLSGLNLAWDRGGRRVMMQLDSIMIAIRSLLLHNFVTGRFGSCMYTGNLTQWRILVLKI